MQAQATAMPETTAIDELVKHVRLTNDYLLNCLAYRDPHAEDEIEEVGYVATARQRRDALELALFRAARAPRPSAVQLPLTAD